MFLFLGGLTIFLLVWPSKRKRSYVIRPKIVKMWQIEWSISLTVSKVLKGSKVQ